MQFSFLHAADLHLDTPFSGVHRVDERIATLLRDATIQAFENLVTAAQEEEVDFVLIAGDIYDGPQRGVRAQLALRNGLDRLARAGIRCFLVHGNHDPVEEGWSAVRVWPEGVTVFGANDVESVAVERDGKTIAIVHGISFPQRVVTQNLARRFARANNACFQIGLLHCNVGVNTDHAPYSPCTMDDLIAAQLDYWALGHVHNRQILRRDRPCIAYPGSLQGLSPKRTEHGQKGALRVVVEGGGVTALDFRPLDVVRFDEMALDISTIPDVATLVDALVEAARERAAAQDGRSLVLRASLSGRGEVHTDLRRVRLREQLLDPVRQALAPATPPIWLDSIEDQTRSAVDPSTLRDRGDFAADLVAAAEVAIGTPTGSELLIPHLGELPLSEMHRLLGAEIDAPPTEAEIRQALDIALDHVVDAGE